MTIKQARRILGVSLRASGEQIHAQFRQRAKQTHPDSTGKGDAAAFLQLLAAYEELRKLLKDVGNLSATQKETDAEDFEREWALREQEIRAAFERIRQRFRDLGLSETLFEELADHIRAYATAAKLREGFEKDSQTTARDFIARLEAKLRQEVATIPVTFNQKLDDLYSVFYELVKKQRCKWILTSPEFWGAVAGTAVILVPLLSLWPGFSAQEVALYSSIGSVQGGYWIARLLLWWSGTRKIIKLDPKGLARFAVGIKAIQPGLTLEGRK
jgi:hypothetical protein